MAGEQGILTINRGIQAIIRIIDDIVIHLINQKKIAPKTQNIESMVDEVEYYLEPLMSYINSIDDSTRKELKGFLGGSADNKFWRSFQKVIADKCDDFDPDGLKEYIENETKQYNNVSREYLSFIEEKVKETMAEALHSYYGDKWMIKGLPKTIYKNAEKLASDRNYELLSNDEDGSIEAWDCINLSDCRDIIIYSHNWSEIFEPIMTRPEDKELSTKDQKTNWLVIMSKEINKLSKQSYSVPKSTFEMISEVYNWLSDNE